MIGLLENEPLSSKLVLWSTPKNNPQLTSATRVGVRQTTFHTLEASSETMDGNSSRSDCDVDSAGETASRHAQHYDGQDLQLLRRQPQALHDPPRIHANSACSDLSVTDRVSRNTLGRVSSTRSNSSDTDRSCPPSTEFATSRQPGSQLDPGTPLSAPVGSGGGSSSKPSQAEDGRQPDRKTTEGPIKTIHQQDILLGRGRPFQDHPGNLRMHRIVNMYRDRYTESTRSDKPLIVKLVLNTVKDDGRCRFLRRVDASGTTGRWEQVPDEVALDKISHAFRNKARRGPEHVEAMEYEAVKHRQGQRHGARAFEVPTGAQQKREPEGTHAGINPKSNRNDIVTTDVKVSSGDSQLGGENDKASSHEKPHRTTVLNAVSAAGPMPIPSPMGPQPSQQSASHLRNRDQQLLAQHRLFMLQRQIQRAPNATLTSPEQLQPVAHPSSLPISAHEPTYDRPREDTQTSHSTPTFGSDISALLSTISATQVATSTSTLLTTQGTVGSTLPVPALQANSPAHFQVRESSAYSESLAAPAIQRLLGLSTEQTEQSQHELRRLLRFQSTGFPVGLLQSSSGPVTADRHPSILNRSLSAEFSTGASEMASTSHQSWTSRLSASRPQQSVLPSGQLSQQGLLSLLPLVNPGHSQHLRLDVPPPASQGTARATPDFHGIATGAPMHGGVESESHQAINRSLQTAATTQESHRYNNPPAAQGEAAQFLDMLRRYGLNNGPRKNGSSSTPDRG